MARLHKTEPFVLQALENNPATRGDDFLLILEVLKNYIPVGMSLDAVFENHVLLGIPSFKTITRNRRKLQKQHPELKCPKAAKIREIEINDYIEYSAE